MLRCTNGRRRHLPSVRSDRRHTFRPPHSSKHSCTKPALRPSSLCQKVAFALLTRGRLSLPQLVRFTGMKPRTVRASIIVLIQHNILWHAHTDDEGEMLEFHTLECLLRLRFGRYVWLAENLFGRAVRPFRVSRAIHHHKAEWWSCSFFFLFLLLSGCRDHTNCVGSRKASTTRYHITTVSLRS